MGRAFAEGVLNGSVVRKEELALIERREERAAVLRRDLECECWVGAAEAPLTQFLIIAIKPQDLARAAPSIQSLIGDNTIVISILAGVSSAVLRQTLATERPIVRAMPNLPATIGSGMTAYAIMGECSSLERENICAIFKAVGEALEVRDEKLLNAVTAVSGSGPAYIYYYIQAWRNAALDLGFNEAEANVLIAQTIKGATELWEESGYHADTLRQRVTSKGGTTEAAQKVLDEAQSGVVLRRAINRAAQRAIELEQLVKEAL
jgi:pyrroline-5-carboxylate reductase